MEILLVRHGQTSGNVAHRHQLEDTPLSKEGRKQVYDATENIKKFKPTHLLSSNLVRTIQTAHIIGESVDLVTDTSEHLIELVRPASMYGNRHRSLKSMFFYFTWFFGRGGTGESYKDLLKRFIKAKELIATYPEDARLVVVSHSVFISLFVAHICREKVLSPLRAALVFRKIVSMPNAHIIKLSFAKDQKKNTCAWSVE